jgi:hypothetical protein
MLAAVDVERSGRGMTAEDKLKHYVRTTMLFLEDDDSVSAERFLVKVCCSPDSRCDLARLPFGGEQVSNASNVQPLILGTLQHTSRLNTTFWIIPGSDAEVKSTLANVPGVLVVRLEHHARAQLLSAEPLEL